MRRQWLIQPLVRFDDRASRLNDEAVSGCRLGHDLDGDTGLDCSPGDGLAGVALVDPHVVDGGRDPFGLAQPLGECGPITGDALRLDESTTPAVRRLRRPERVRASPRTVLRIRAQA